MIERKLIIGNFYIGEVENLDINKGKLELKFPIEERYFFEEWFNKIKAHFSDGSSTYKKNGFILLPSNNSKYPIYGIFIQELRNEEATLCFDLLILNKPTPIIDIIPKDKSIN